MEQEREESAHDELKCPGCDGSGEHERACALCDGAPGMQFIVVTEKRRGRQLMEIGESRASCREATKPVTEVRGKH